MATQTYDAILVLGGGINLDASLSEEIKAQIEKAVELFKLHSPNALIFSGLYGYKLEKKPPMSEVKAYAQYAEQLGVNPEMIRLEERSQETLGNILFTKMEILIPNGWTRILVIPNANHLNERIAYLLQTILGPTYSWEIVRVGENLDSANVAREQKALDMTKQINNVFEDGDHDAIYAGLMQTHPAYGGSKWSVEELRKELGQVEN